MKSFYSFLSENNYFWDRKGDRIWVAVNGYKVFDERWELLMSAASQAKALHVDVTYDELCGKTFYWFKERK